MKYALFSALLFSSLTAHGASPSTPAPGEAEFRVHCMGCHSIACNRRGPKLQDIFGRKAGTLGDFMYTDSLKNSGIVWAEETMDAYLRDPATLVPGTSMTFGRVESAEQRRDIIAFLHRQDKSSDLCI